MPPLTVVQQERSRVIIPGYQYVTLLGFFGRRNDHFCGLDAFAQIASGIGCQTQCLSWEQKNIAVRIEVELSSAFRDLRQEQHPHMLRLLAATGGQVKKSSGTAPINTT